MKNICELIEKELKEKYRNVKIEIKTGNSELYTISFYLENFNFDIVFEFSYDELSSFIENKDRLCEIINNEILEKIYNYIILDIKN